MSDRFTDSIEPLALATQGRTIEGRIPLTELSRLCPLLQSNRGEAQFILHFDIDEGGVPSVQGSIQTTLMLQCQRCMDDMEYPVSTKIRLGIVRTREAAEHLPDNFDPLVLSGEEISIVSILEDELILALPIVAMHKIEECSQYDEFLESESSNQVMEPDSMTSMKRKNPFAVLAQLKETQSVEEADNANFDSKKNDEE